MLATREALGCGLGGNTEGLKRHLQSLLRDKKEHVLYFPYLFMCFTYSYETAGGLCFR